MLDEALIASSHRAMLQPSHWNAARPTRKITYGVQRAPDNDNRWWLDDGGADAAPHELSEAEQRAQIEDEPAFACSFLMGFGDPGGMLKELVVLPDFGHDGKPIKGTGAYVGPAMRKGSRLAEPLRTQQLRNGSVPAQFDVANHPPAEDRRIRPQSARVSRSWTRQTAEPPKGSAAVSAEAAAYATPLQTQASRETATDGRVVGRPASAGTRPRSAFGGNPLSRARNEGHDPTCEHATSLGLMGSYFPVEPTVCLREPGRPRESGTAVDDGEMVAASAAAAAAHATVRGGGLRTQTWVERQAQVRAEEVARRPVIGTQRTNRRDPLAKGSRRTGASLRPSTSASYMCPTASSSGGLASPRASEGAQTPRAHTTHAHLPLFASAPGHGQGHGSSAGDLGNLTRSMSAAGWTTSRSNSGLNRTVSTGESTLTVHSRRSS
ncbi:hypothetical protein T492DRAFT_1017246 [Pavlovales sp. CCMP2436]|nr:hypothetical protein T492DRAFT_1017246 [Pavlovales sp. CCMP2436]